MSDISDYVVIGDQVPQTTITALLRENADLRRENRYLRDQMEHLCEVFGLRPFVRKNILKVPQ